ncbi:MAG: hypothetical protein GW821_17685 [Shewanella vesiculosa]|nr:hypothetical protein [Shewanella vesiculosa]NCQ46817.1 hypothetical protein [Shewanella frigidimarina]NCP38456.1 hypothetical protein [Shewanella vesiculosa]NCP71417.1 hypothetical protein [Shewanella vesiculosa]NCP76108.1 hypothetical protein [Shewanella vesiculosa]
MFLQFHCISALNYQAILIDVIGNNINNLQAIRLI